MSRDNGRLGVEQKTRDTRGISREDGMHTGIYVRRITVLLFLKMMDEWEQFSSEPIEVPKDYQWSMLKGKDGERLPEHYNHTVPPTPGDQDGVAGDVSARVNSQFRTPINLREVIREIGEVE